LDGKTLALESKDVGGNSQSGLLYFSGERERVFGAGHRVRSGDMCTGTGRGKKTTRKGEGRFSLQIFEYQGITDLKEIH